ncbi:hypothetical protein [Bradyrhizobium sp. SUTN9-2]|uniref:hypothetical protein n=1 Tax=Bradyrhizobium sp. SUTN9-2 TaxID=1167456 RepID=UPI001FCE708F|nr:hypothetical protein [Bradyrhizobium sp. SUTN9-2]
MEANYFDALDHAAQRLAERRNLHSENHSGDFIKFLRDAYGIRKAQAPEDLGKGMIWRLDNNAKTLFLSGDTRVETGCSGSLTSSASWNGERESSGRSNRHD